MQITKNQDGTYTLQPSANETEMLDAIAGQGTGAEFKNLIEQWIVTKYHNQKIDKGRKLANKFVNASTSDQDAVIAILWGT